MLLTVDQAIPEVHRPHIINDAIPKIGKVLYAPHANDRLVRASQWLFDSYSGSSELLKFVQAMIAMEILLGDKAGGEVVGLGTLLANRCAYLIGTSRKQREEILEDFGRIYNTRSRIVHDGHNRLSAAEESDLWKLRWMVGRGIQEELDLMLADEKS